MIPIMLKSDTKLSETLQLMGTITNDHWFYLPFWFQKQSNGDLLAYHLDNVPERLKEILESHRKKQDDTKQ